MVHTPECRISLLVFRTMMTDNQELLMLQISSFPGQERKRILRGCGRVALLAVWIVILEQKARAYTDPGSGQLLWQTLIAASVGLAFSFHRILAWLRSFTKGKQTDEARDE